MLYRLFLACLAACLAFVTAGQAAAQPVNEQPVARKGPPAGKGRPIPGRFIVTLEPRADARAVAREHGVEPDFVYTQVLVGFAGRMSDAARSGLLRDNRVVRVEQDREMVIHQSWGTDRIDQRNLPLSGSYTAPGTGRGMTVYVVDTGIRADHLLFAGRASVGYDAIRDGQNGADCNGHGTHVAGTAVGNRGYGVAAEATVVAVRVLDCEGSGANSGVIAGLDWIAANGRRPGVVNMSLGGDVSASLDDAVRRVIARGLPVVVAAGNETVDACAGSPSRVPEAITVAASTRSDARASFSNYGSCVDVFAPGQEITSAWYTANNVVAVLDGTSMATPHVAGLVALMLERTPTASPATIASTLVQSATPNLISGAQGSPNKLIYTGAVSTTAAPAPAPAPSGNDVLSGTAGADRLAGGTGDDIYYVNNAGDVVVELSGEGNDRVATSVSYTLPAAAEIERFEAITLTATTPLDLFGNVFNQSIVGNNGPNRIASGGGNDTLNGAGGDDLIQGGNAASAMYGGPGNDTFYVMDSSDAVIEAPGEGSDRIAASASNALPAGSEVEVIEAITLSATTPMSFTGSDYANTLRGNNGPNSLDGRGGSDVLQGLGGADSFVFSTAPGVGNIDQILDFTPGADKVVLGAAVFPGLPAGSLSAANFVSGSRALDSSDRVIYNPQTGSLLYDPDGTGAAAAVEFARAAAGLAISAADFRVQ